MSRNKALWAVLLPLLALGRPAAGIAKHSRPQLHKRTLITTGYCLHCRICGTTGITKLGSRGAHGVAVGRRRRAIALGSLVNIPGYGSAKIDDVGGGVGGNALDLRFRTHREARRWGRRRVTVLVK